MTQKNGSIFNFWSFTHVKTEEGLDGKMPFDVLLCITYLNGRQCNWMILHPILLYFVVLLIIRKYKIGLIWIARFCNKTFIIMIEPFWVVHIYNVINFNQRFKGLLNKKYQKLKICVTSFMDNPIHEILRNPGKLNQKLWEYGDRNFYAWRHNDKRDLIWKGNWISFTPMTQNRMCVTSRSVGIGSIF